MAKGRTDREEGLERKLKAGRAARGGGTQRGLDGAVMMPGSREKSAPPLYPKTKRYVDKTHEKLSLS